MKRPPPPHLPLPLFFWGEGTAVHRLRPFVFFFSCYRRILWAKEKLEAKQQEEGAYLKGAQGILPRMACTRRLSPKGYPFQASGMWKGREICHCGLWKDLKGLTNAVKKKKLENFLVYRLIHIQRYKGEVTRDDSQRRFLAQHSVGMLEQCCNHLKQCRSNVGTLKSFGVTSP